ncbi:NlpC/P60 family protein [Candidatus Clostridium stratigraminis]|uniref:NlpC/P60 family protein n=1 Tax=Candidatus Clostridium stratigraminis TaxID=3381661 RepID=A0ABW8SYW3_9CLOT
MKFTNKVTSIILSTAVIITSSTTVFADPTVDSLNNQKQQLENQKKQDNSNMQKSQLNADSAQKDINNLNTQIQMLDSKIESLNRTIEDTKTKITAKEADIQTAQKNYDEAEEELKDEQDLFNKRMRAMYIAGDDQYISILLSSKDINDFLSKAQAIVSIINFDNKLIKDFQDKKEKIKSAEATLMKDKDELTTYKKENESKLAEVRSNIENQRQLVAEAKSRQAYYISQISEYRNKVAAEEKQVQDTIKKLQALAQSQPQNNGVGVPAAPNAIVAYAYTFLGDPYVWSAEGEILTQAVINEYKNTDHDLTGMEGYIGRQSFDCSGLMQYVYAHFGIHISRTTYTQINEGTPVSRNNLQPGDLIFFGTYSDPHHVGMYVGNNCYIQAPYSGDVVRVSSLDNADQYLCARRILK